MTLDLTDHVALVTGATGGIGETLARGLATSGARVCLVARNVERLERLASTCGDRASAFPADVTVPEGVDALARAVRDQVGAPSILVNAAGTFGPISRIESGDPREWIGTLMVNTVGPYLTCRAFSPEMAARGWGRILNVTSAASLHAPGALNSAYATSKVALNQFTRHLASELRGTGVTANVFHPGEVKTEMWADIAEQASAAGPEAGEFTEWVRLVERTGGDPPAKALKLVLDHIGDEHPSTGSFLWIDAPLQQPIPAWETAATGAPWSS